MEEIEIAKKVPPFAELQVAENHQQAKSKEECSSLNNGNVKLHFKVED